MLNINFFDGQEIFKIPEIIESKFIFNNVIHNLNIKIKYMQIIFHYKNILYI